MPQDSNRSLLIPRSRRRDFVLRFTGLTILGFALGSIAKAAIDYLVKQLLLNPMTKQFLSNKLPFEFLYRLLLREVYSSNLSYEAPIYLISEILKGAAFGAILGATQWIIIRRYLRFSKFWIVANSVGYALSSWLLLLAFITAFFPKEAEQIIDSGIRLIPAQLNYTPAGLLVFFMIAALIALICTNSLTGFAQWLVLRKTLRSIWWWLFVSGAIALVTAVLSLPFLILSRMIMLSSIQAVEPLIGIVFVIVSGVIYGMIQSLSLCLCHRLPRDS